MNKSFSNIGIIGAGAWGTALAIALHAAGKPVTLWTRRAELAAEITRTGRNSLYLPERKLSSEIAVTADAAALREADLWLLAVPAQFLRSTLSCFASSHQKQSLVVTAKGVELKTNLLMSEVARQVFPNVSIAVLSGPSFASEVAEEKPTALTLAVEDPELGDRLVSALSTPRLRLYLGHDIVGTQIGGAVKNVLAISCGIVIGRGLGENARAALLTRGLAEVTRLGIALGGKAETFMGLAGLGDLVLTCGSNQSRNLSLGMALGQGKLLTDILASRHSVTEGIASAKAVQSLALQHGIDMPIVKAVSDILDGSISIDAAIDGLLTRPRKHE